MIAPGVVIRETRALSQADFDRFARLSGDDNPIHVDPVFSARTRFGRTVSHGMLIYSVIWGMLHRHLPVRRQLSQSLMFPNPAFADEALEFAATVQSVTSSAALLAIEVRRAADGALACDGRAEFELAETAQ